MKPLITIPLPTDIPYGYGIAATSGPQGCLIQARATTPERDKIQQAAAAIGVSYGTFMRRVTNDAADYVLAQIENPEEQAATQL